MARQIGNLRWWRERAGGGDVLEHHYGRLESALAELELAVAEGERPLEAARTTVELIGAEPARGHQKQQYWTQALLATVGVALAVPQMVDRDVPERLLELAGVAVPAGGYDVPLLLVVQVLVILVVAAAAGLVVSIRGRGLK